MGEEKHYSNAKLIEITLDEESIGRTTPEIEHEREVAIFDLLESNVFELEQGAGGPYTLKLLPEPSQPVPALSGFQPTCATRKSAS